MELDKRAKELLEAAFIAREALLKNHDELYAEVKKITDEPDRAMLMMLEALQSGWRQAAVDFTEYCIGANFHK